MADGIRRYCNNNPVQRKHQKAGEKVAVSSPPLSTGWAWNPTKEDQQQINRGNRRFRKAKKLKEMKDNPETEDSVMATKKAKGTKASKKKVSKKKSAKKVSAKKVSKKTSNLVPLKKICQELKIDPKMARRKLRAADLKGHDSSSRWEFTQAQAKKAKEILAA